MGSFCSYLKTKMYCSNKKTDEGFPKQKKVKVVFVMGGPGSGKGTQCAKIVQEFGYTQLSVGDLLRKEVKAGSESGTMIQNMMTEGKLVPSDITVRLIQKAVQETDNDKFLIDGIPRNKENLAAFQNLISYCFWIVPKRRWKGGFCLETREEKMIILRLYRSSLKFMKSQLFLWLIIMLQRGRYKRVHQSMWNKRKLLAFSFMFWIYWLDCEKSRMRSASLEQWKPQARLQLKNTTISLREIATVETIYSFEIMGIVG